MDRGFFNMRIIAGQAGGIPLQVPRNVTRPTTDRVREAVFSMLGDLVPGSRVLDLYAGTGGFGLEALSRGAASALFIDQNRGAVQAIEKNLKKARLENGRTLTADITRWKPPTEPAFDLVFADPPYAKKAEDPDLAAALARDENFPRCVTENGHLILEVHHPPREFQPAPAWKPADYRRYGKTGVWILQKSSS